jgi:hypothetical protein
MAQSALTVTNPNPTPPTNMSFTGSTMPNPASYDPAILTSAGTGAGDGQGDLHYPRAGTPGFTPSFDDGIPAALPSSTAAGSNLSTINENAALTTWPTAITFTTNHAVVPVGGTSVNHEAAGSETVVVATSVNPIPGIGTTAPAQLRMVGVGPALTAASRAAGPNASHASSFSPTTPLTPTTVATPSGVNNVANGLATVLTVPGTNFDRTSIVNINGVPQNTNYVSASSLTVTNAVKRTSAGTYPITVTNGSSGITSNATNWTMT